MGRTEQARCPVVLPSRPGECSVTKQRIVCVLGMHRSGTSLLARLLNLLGVELGENHLLNNEPVSANPKGHWEHRELSAINDALLDHYGGTWDKPPQFPSGWQNDPALYDLRLRAHTLVNDQFRDYTLWGWKDPRTCLTLPFWQELLSELHYLICLR